MPIGLVEDFNVCVDSWELLERYLKLAIPTCLNDPQEVALRFVTYDEEGVPDVVPRPSTPHAFPVMLLQGGRKPTGTFANNYFSGGSITRLFDLTRQDATNYMIDILRAELLRGHPEWGQTFRRIVRPPYEGGDGTIITGYQLSSYGSFPNGLAIGLAHFYYGK